MSMLNGEVLENPEKKSSRDHYVAVFKTFEIIEYNNNYNNKFYCYGLISEPTSLYNSLLIYQISYF